MEKERGRGGGRREGVGEVREGGKKEGRGRGEGRRRDERREDEGEGGGEDTIVIAGSTQEMVRLLLFAYLPNREEC